MMKNFDEKFNVFEFAKDAEMHISLYNDNGEVDCSNIAKQYGGGGHSGAAGFRIMHFGIDQFISVLKRQLYLENVTYQIARDYKTIEGTSVVSIYLPNGHNRNGDVIKVENNLILHICTSPCKIDDGLWEVNAFSECPNNKVDLNKYLVKGSRYEFLYGDWDEPLPNGNGKS